MGDLNTEAERFADETDHASNISIINTDEAIREHLRNLEKAPDDFDGTHCTVCGEEIPAERLATGAWRDLYCQTIFEKRRKDYNA